MVTILACVRHIVAFNFAGARRRPGERGRAKSNYGAHVFHDRQPLLIEGDRARAVRCGSLPGEVGIARGEQPARAALRVRAPLCAYSMTSRLQGSMIS